MTTLPFVIADPSARRIFGYYPTEDKARADVPHANAHVLAPAAGWRLMTYAAYLTAARPAFLAGPLRPITAERYAYARDVQLTTEVETENGLTRFLFASYLHGRYTEQFAEWHGQYFQRMVDAHDRATWITAAECAAAHGVLSRLRAKPASDRPDTLGAYHCRSCGLFHLGNTATDTDATQPQP
jgi:hypothetical protein